MSNQIFYNIAKSQKDITEVYQLRWKIYSEEKFINPDDYPSKMFNDKYDKFTTNFTALQNSELIGVARLIFYSTIGLPTFNSHNIIIPETIKSLKDVVEIGRFMIKKEYRALNHEITFGLSNELYRFLISTNKIKWVLAEMPEKLVFLFNELGFIFNILNEKEPTDFNMSERSIISGYHERKIPIYPVLCNLKDVNPNYNYFNNINI